jgi:hypothetical protein
MSIIINLKDYQAIHKGTADIIRVAKWEAPEIPIVEI